MPRPPTGARPSPSSICPAGAETGVSSGLSRHGLVWTLNAVPQQEAVRATPSHYRRPDRRGLRPGRRRARRGPGVCAPEHLPEHLPERCAPPRSIQRRRRRSALSQLARPAVSPRHGGRGGASRPCGTRPGFSAGHGRQHPVSAAGHPAWRHGPDLRPCAGSAAAPGPDARQRLGRATGPRLSAASRRCAATLSRAPASA